MSPPSSVLLRVLLRRSARPILKKRGLSRSEFPRTIKITDNVYGYEDFHSLGMTTVSLFVIGNDGVLLADGQGSPAATQKLLDAIAKVTPKPVKWYIVGSDHGDHTAGNSVLPKDITYIVVTPFSRQQMKLDAPAMTGDKQVINVGGIEVQALYLGRAHTGGDLRGLPAEAEDPVHERGLPQSRLPGDAIGLSDRMGLGDRQGVEAGCRPLRARPRLHRRTEDLARGAASNIRRRFVP